jgi:UDP-N-acetylglucosamine 2-epimerase (non-hydrolysing)
LSQRLFTTEKSGDENLRREGLQEGVHFVGNCMVDSLRKHVASAVLREPWRAHGVAPGEYALLTLHRPANVDEPETLAALLSALEDVARRLPIVFPVHPRTRESMARLRPDLSSGVRLTNPLPYLDFLGLMAKARLVLTDSGGIQEETTALGVPCMTLRTNTERPVTISDGTNRLVGTDPAKIREGVEDVLGGKWPAGVLPPLWDGKAGVRIVDIVEKLVSV